MLREFLNSTIQKKFFVMFFISLIYIAGLFAYFTDSAVVTAFIIMVLGIFIILKNYLSPKLVLFWYCMFFFAFFNASLRVKNSDALYQIAPQNAIIQGQIISIPIRAKDKTKFIFETSKINYSGKTENIHAKTLVTTINNDFNTGDFYEFKGKLRTPFEASNPSQFNYAKYLRNFNIFTVFYANEVDCKNLKIPLSFKWKFLQGLNNVRKDIIQAHSKYLKSPNLELLGGIVFGDDAISPPDEIKVSFQRSGLLHLLAASGMNVALIYGIWFFILRKLRVPFNLTVSSGIFIVIFYALMTGLGPSVIRAAFMLIFILIGKLIDRDAHSISLLSFVALLMLIYNPAFINDVGFQLSFLVTFGLLITVPVVFEKIKSVPAWLSGAIFVPIIAQIWVAPIQMYYFNSFSLYSVFANILILPFVTVISFGGFISSVLALVKPVADWICLIFDFILNPVLNIVVTISNYFANLPHSLIQTPQPNVLQIFLYYSIVLFAALLFKISKDKKTIILICTFSIILIFSFIKIPDNNLETIIFNVQNADAFLVKTPRDKYFIIDSGKIGYKGGKTQAKMIILEYLKDRGIKNIEGFVITHFDSDHAGGAIDLIENLNIKNVYVNSLKDKSSIAQKIYKKAGKKIQIAKNNEIVYKENNLIIKNFIADFKGENFENEKSVITIISNDKFDELFMGDAGIPAFEKIEKYLPEKVEVLKVGHHGAKNVINDAFLKRIKPDIAIISTGLNNYGHPNGVTLDTLQLNKIKILRTDKQSSIKINKEKNNYKIYSYNKNKQGFVKIF